MKSTLWLTAAVLAILLLPTPVAAAVCADYPNQAAAQQSADTRDPDGDGRYCVISPR